MAKQVLYIEETSVAELITLIGPFCDAREKYVPFGTNLYGAFKMLRRTGHIENVVNKFGVEFPVNKVPQELVQAVQGFMVKGSVADHTIVSLFENQFDKRNYLTKYTLEEPKRLKAEFVRFRDELMKFINKKWKSKGLTIRRLPKKGDKK